MRSVASVLTVLIILFVLTLLPQLVSSQERGKKSFVSKNLSFQREIPNVILDPAPLTGSSSRVNFTHTFSNSDNRSIGSGIVKNILGANGLSIPGWLEDLTSGVSFFCSGIKPTFGVSASVDVGGYYEIHSIGKSNIGINYPVSVSVSFPEANTFACGEIIKIQTSCTIIDPEKNDKLKVDAPFINQEIGPVLKNLSFSATFGLDAWVGYGIEVPYPCGTLTDPLKMCSYKKCGDVAGFDKSKSFSITPSVPSLPSLLNICDKAFGPEANEASLLSCNWSQMSPLLKLAQSAVDGYNQTHHTDYNFASFPDNNTVVIAPPDFPSASPAPTIPEMEGTFKSIDRTQLTSQSLDGGKRLKVSGNKSSVSKMSVDLVSLLDYYKLTTSLSLGGGMGSIDIGDISPTFSVNQKMDFEFTPVVNLNIDLGMPMDYSVFSPDGTLSHSSFGQLVALVAGQYIEARFPQNCSSPSDVKGSSSLNGEFKSVIDHEYYRSIQVKFGEVAVSGGPNFTLVNETVANSKFDSDQIVKHGFTLETGNTLSLPTFVLDPENPSISVDKVTVEDVLTLGNGLKAVVYRMQISNTGDVRLNNLELDFDLAKTFQKASDFSVECMHSDQLELDQRFDGKSVVNILSPGNTLGFGESAIIEVLVRVKPEISAIAAQGCFSPVIYAASAKAYGVSPIGTRVENNYNQCTQKKTGDDVMASVDLGASVVSGIDDYAVYGWDLVKFDKPQEKCMGNVGSGKDLVFENSVGTIIIGDLHAGEQLFVQGGATIEADYIATSENVKMPNWKALLNLNGALSENSTCVAVQPVINFQFPAVTRNAKITIKKGKSKLIDPGEYNSLTLEEGAEVILISGEYHIGRWSLAKNSSVTYRTEGGPIVINLETWMTPGSNLNLKIEGGGNVNDIRHNYSGKQKCTFSASVVEGRIIAPQAEIEFSDGSVLHGTCYAKTVNFKNGASFRGPKFLEKMNISPECQYVLVPGSQPKLKSGSVQHQVGDSMPSPEGLFPPVKVYPNPTEDLISIDGLPANEKVDIKIFNSGGQLVQHLQPISKRIVVDLSSHPAGIYYIHVNGYRLEPVIKK